MSYGIVAYGTDNKIAFHSEYSSVVYAGQMSTTTSAVQPTYTGDFHIAINSSTRSSNYDMGHIIQYSISLDVDFLVPFPGGMPIRTESGHLIGAIGISGATGDQDEECAIAAIEAVKDLLK